MDIYFVLSQFTRLRDDADPAAECRPGVVDLGADLEWWTFGGEPKVVDLEWQT